MFYTWYAASSLVFSAVSVAMEAVSVRTLASEEPRLVAPAAEPDPPLAVEEASSPPGATPGAKATSPEGEGGKVNLGNI